MKSHKYYYNSQYNCPTHFVCNIISHTITLLILLIYFLIPSHTSHYTILLSCIYIYISHYYTNNAIHYILSDSCNILYNQTHSYSNYTYTTKTIPISLIYDYHDSYHLSSYHYYVSIVHYYYYHFLPLVYHLHHYP